MTALIDEELTPAPAPAPAARWRLTGWRRTLALAVLGLIAFAAVRTISGADDLTSGGTIGAAIGLGVPIGMAGLGGLWSERSGVVNIGLEGMMILGTFGAGWIGYQHGPWAGLLAAVVAGALGGLIHAVATVTFGVDHIVSGVAVTILAQGITQYLADAIFTGKPGGGQSQSPPIPQIGTWTVPGLDSGLLPVERHQWFLVSDVAGILRGLTVNLSPVTVLAVLLVVGSYLVLWKTPFGLRLRSCGEDPEAAESLGVNVYRYKYIAVVVSGAMAGFGGGFMAEVAASVYREGQTGGRGYIGLAAMIFGNWRPGGLAAGAGLFGYTDAMQLRNAAAVHALLLLLAVLLAALAVRSVLQRRWVGAGLALVFAAGSLIWYLVSDSLPSQVTFMAPYLTTLLVLALASQSLRMPKADGLIYRRGGR